MGSKMVLEQKILGNGVYTPREAARLVGTSAQQVLRWTRGNGQAEPLWKAHYDFLDEDVTEISFLDLIEIRVVSAMRRAGISLQAIRFAISFAQDKYGIDRPLASESFKTDGKEVLMSAVERDGEMVSLSKKHAGQKVFKALVAQSLSGLEYENTLVARWRPKGFSDIVLDPKRFFGDPILDKYAVSTSTLHKEFIEFKDKNYLSSIYEVPKISVQKAIDFEERLNATNGQNPV